MSFTVTDRSMWPDLLTLDQVAAIWQRTPGGIRKALERGRFTPLPILSEAGGFAVPLRWRKTAVVRYLDGGHQVSFRKVG